MIRHLACALALGILTTTTLPAQTIRFDTNVGTFDMKLNPTGNPNLQGHVDNILAYVESGRYDTTVINRVNEVSTGGVPDFVLQMGGFQAPQLTVPDDFNVFPGVPRFDPVVVDEDGDGAIDFDTTGFTNSRGTVSLALSGEGPNSGTSSFFINLNDNPDLDPGGSIGEFIPFAEIVNMETVNLIQALNTVSIPGGGVGSSNIPILEDNHLVFVERAFVVPTPQTMSQSNSSSASSSSGGSAASTATDLVVPEPNTLLLAAGALLLLAARNRKRGF